jgi:tetratricopeptide (TPR) repeat protein
MPAFALRIFRMAVGSRAQVRSEVVRATSRRVVALLFFLLSPIVCAGPAAFAQESTGKHQDSDQLLTTAESYEKYLHSGNGTPESRVEVRQHLGAVYYLLHRYRESLDTLAPVLHDQQPKPLSNSTLAAQSWLVSGLDHLELNELPEATRALRHSLEMKPDSANTRLALGDALARSGQMEAAAEQYEIQIRQTPSLADAWYKLGLVHSQISVKVSRLEVKPAERHLPQQLEAEELLAKGDTLNAARILFRIVRSSSQAPEVHAELGTALLTLGYVKAAQDHLHQELTRNPESPLAQLGLVQTAALAGDWSQVSALLRRLSESEPRELMRLLEFPPAGLIVQSSSGGQMTPPESFTNSEEGQVWKSWLSDSNLVPRLSANQRPNVRSCALSETMSRPGNWLSAACYSELAHQLKAKKALSLNDTAKLSEAEFRLGQYDGALRTAKKLRSMDPKSGWAIYWESKAHDAIAEECFLKVGELNPDSARVHQMLGEHYTKLSDYPKAKVEFEGALRLAPDSADLHLGLGKVLSRTSDWAGAEKELLTALTLAPKSSFAHYELGHVYVQQSQWQRAIEQLRQVPDDSTVLLSSRLDLAQAESESGQTAEAVNSLLAVASLDRDGELYFRLAALYRSLGDQTKAREALTTFKQRRAASLQTDTQEVGALEKEQEIRRSTDLKSP